MTRSGAEPAAAFVSKADISGAVFHAMMDALPAAVCMTDSEGRLTYFNSAAVKLSGRTPEIGTDRWCIAWQLFLADGTPLPQ